MSEPLTGNEQDAMDYLYGGGDEEIECRSVAWIVTRYSHECLSIMHEGERTQPAGSRMAMERAKVEGKFGSCYTCAACVEKSWQEINERYED